MVAGELYATIEDINAHLPPGKAEIEDAEDDLLQVDAYRFIRSKLVGTFATTTLALWLDPTTTPDVIRAIAGRLIAAKWYMEIYAEDSDEDAEYAQRIYDEAMMMIQGILDGNIVVIDPGTDEPYPEVNTGMLVEASFWPNDDAPKFTMDMEFA